MPDERVGLATTEGPGRKPVPPHDVAGGRLRVAPSLCAPPSPAAPPARFERRHDAHQTTVSPALPSGAGMHPPDLPGRRPPFPAVSRAPLQGFGQLPVQAELHMGRQPMSASLKPQGGPAIGQGHRRESRPPSMAPPTAPLSLPFDARRQGPRRQRSPVRPGGPPFTAVPSRVVRMVP